MARRRLSPPIAAEPLSPHPAPSDRGAAPAPIARIAADAASSAAAAELARTLEEAREGGRLVLDLPLEVIAPDHLTRDRIPSEDEDMTALRASIQAHGQRTPIEVTPIEGALPYGLLSGWRRLAALKTLHAETRDARFATVQALVRRLDSLADAYVAMVEENEVRVGLSQYERARVVARAAARGVFPDEEAALQALFGTASRPRRSRIRAFLDIYRALDADLRFPAHLPERLGLRLVERLRAGGTEAVRVALAAAAPATPEVERAALEAVLRPAPAPKPKRDTVLPGLQLDERRNGDSITLTLRGPGLTPERAGQIRALLQRMAAEE